MGFQIGGYTIDTKQNKVLDARGVEIPASKEARRALEDAQYELDQKSKNRTIPELIDSKIERGKVLANRAVEDINDFEKLNPEIANAVKIGIPAAAAVGLGALALRRLKKKKDLKN